MNIHAPMRILLVHNRYQQRGGEDTVLEREAQLLRDAGHEVEIYERHNDDIADMGTASLAVQTLWSERTVRDVTALAARFRPDVAHVHNTFPLISPSVYPTLKRAGIPIVQTLHNYRLLCLNAMLLRESIPCEDCVGGTPWRGVMRGCYRDSSAKSAVLAATITVHREHTIYRCVDRFIALTEFARALFVRAGMPERKIVVKPNFVHDNGRPPDHDRNGLLYVGRLSEEKGIGVLAQAARMIPDIRIDVIGDGPCAPLLAGIPNVRMLGRRNSEEIRAAMTTARFLMVPSLWYEGFPMTIVEAYEAGLPVIASRIGSLLEIVEDGVTGFSVTPGDPLDLSRSAEAALSADSRGWQLGAAARERYEIRYSPAAQIAVLTSLYRAVGCNPGEL